MRAYLKETAGAIGFIHQFRSPNGCIRGIDHKDMFAGSVDCLFPGFYRVWNKMKTLIPDLVISYPAISCDGSQMVCDSRIAAAIECEFGVYYFDLIAFV